MPKLSTYKNHVEYVDSNNVKDHETKYTSMNYMFKVTAQILSNVRWSASYLNNYYQYRGFDIVNNGTEWGPYGNYDQDFVNHGYDFPNYSASTSLDITIGNNSMLNIRAGLFYSNQENNLTEIATTPWYSFRGLSNQGFEDIPDAYKHYYGWSNRGFGESEAIVKQVAERKNIGADYTLYFNLAGEHSLKIGGEFVRQGEDVNNAFQQPLVLFYFGLTPNIYGTTYEAGKYGFMRVIGNGATGKYGSEYTAYSNRFNVYIQDSWTIGEKLTLNFGLRAESEVIPGYSSDPKYEGLNAFDFGFKDKLAPRFGFVYDVKGDSSFKVFGSYGIFYDVMKLAMAIGSYGGLNYQSAYYPINNADFNTYTLGNFPESELYLVNNHRIPSFDSTDTGLKPMSQQAISFGFENKLSDNLSLSVRLVNKHLRYAIEDVGILTPEGEFYYTANPGFGWTLTENNGGKLDNTYPDTPKAKREYYAVNIGLDKRFSNNWMGGVSYTWSRLTGNYAGLASSDEIVAGGVGRTSPNVQRYYDLWFMAFDKELNKIDGTLATDRTHVLKAYGSYMFPFGLTIGTVANIMSGTPLTEEWGVYTMEIMPYNRGNLGRTPMLYNADLYAEYNLKLGKANLQFSVNVTNVFNFNISTRISTKRNLGDINVTESEMLSGNYEYPADSTPNPLYKMPFGYTAPISARLGLKLSF